MMNSLTFNFVVFYCAVKLKFVFLNKNTTYTVRYMNTMFTTYIDFHRVEKDWGWLLLFSKNDWRIEFLLLVAKSD